MRFFKRKKSTNSISHLNADEIARTTLYHRQSYGWRYREGVIEEAVRRARGAKTIDDVVDAIESAFVEYELLRFFTGPSSDFVAALDGLGVLGGEAT